MQYSEANYSAVKFSSAQSVQFSSVFCAVQSSAVQQCYCFMVGRRTCYANLVTNQYYREKEKQEETERKEERMANVK